MSTLVTTTVQGVQNIKYDSSTTAITIDSGGRVTTPNNPSFLTYGTPTMTISSGTHGYFHSFNNAGQSFNNGGHYNNTTGRFTAPLTGLYQMSVCFYVNDTGDVETNMRFYKNYGFFG